MRPKIDDYILYLGDLEDFDENHVLEEILIKDYI